MTSHRSSPRPHLPHLAWIVSALVLLSLLGGPATSASPALTLHSPAPGELHLTWPAVTPAPPAYHVRYAPADTPLLIKEATSPTNTPDPVRVRARRTLHRPSAGRSWAVECAGVTADRRLPGRPGDGRDHRRRGGGERHHRECGRCGLVFRRPGGGGGLSHRRHRCAGPAAGGL